MRGECDLGTQIDLLEARAATCGYLRRCQGLWKKGDRVLYWNSLLKYMETRVMIRPSLISSIILHPQYRNETGPYHDPRSEEHTSELQSRQYLVCRLLLEKKKKKKKKKILM